MRKIPASILAHRVHTLRCPHCRKPLDTVGNDAGDRPRLMISIICFYCFGGSYLAEDLTLKPHTIELLGELPPESLRELNLLRESLRHGNR